jgi:formamidopyrimidine-DNA glycosylase
VPELPEVEVARRLARRLARGRRIVAVRCADDPLVLDGVSPARLRRALLGRRVIGAGRRGKHFWLELDRRPWPCFHFGMSGELVTRAGPAVPLASRRGAPRPGWPPRHWKLLLDLDDGGTLAFADARRLGRIRLREDPPREPPVSALGFDALRELPPPARFRTLLRARRAPVKAVLLDQGFAAGVGNWLADEVLYQAGLAPRRIAAGLADGEADRLRAALKRVVRTAVARGADGARLPRRWLFHVRWGPRAGARTPGGEPLRFDVVGGRTAAWAPGRQR